MFGFTISGVSCNNISHMFRLRICMTVLLLMVMPIQGVAMAQMFVCDPASSMQTQSLQPSHGEQGDRHAFHPKGQTEHQHHAGDNLANGSSSPLSYDSCNKCSLCAMCGAMVVPTVRGFVTPLISSSHPLGQFTEPATLFPDTLLRPPHILAA